jgi:protein TonB
MRRFALISLGLHVVALTALMGWFAHRPPPRGASDREGTVELVMVESPGSGPTAALPEPGPEQPPPAPSEQAEQPPAPLVPSAEAAERSEPPPSPPVEMPSPDAIQLTLPATAPPPVQQTAQAPVITLPGNESETNAFVIGSRVIPASIDAKFRNREPIYPADAARRAEQGAVFLLIHVSPQGLASGVDVLESSGHVSLDRAARDAVMRWHFLPAIEDGEPVPFDFPIRITFQLE